MRKHLYHAFFLALLLLPLAFATDYTMDFSTDPGITVVDDGASGSLTYDGANDELDYSYTRPSSNYDLYCFPLDSSISGGTEGTNFTIYLRNPTKANSYIFTGIFTSNNYSVAEDEIRKYGWGTTINQDGFLPSVGGDGTNVDSTAGFYSYTAATDYYLSFSRNSATSVGFRVFTSDFTQVYYANFTSDEQEDQVYNYYCMGYRYAGGGTGTETGSIVNLTYDVAAVADENKTYSVNTTENTPETFLFDVKGMSGNSSSTATLEYNNTNYSSSTTFYNSSHIRFSNVLITPLIENNNTNISFKWYYTINNDNGTQNNYTSSTSQQVLRFKYYPGNVTFPVIIEGDLFNLSYVYTSGLATIQAYVDNGTNLSTTALNGVQYSTLESPFPIYTNQTLTNVTLWLNVSYSGQNYFRKFYTNYTNYAINLYPCSSEDENITALNFTLYNSNTSAQVSGNINTHVEAWHNNPSNKKFFNFTTTSSVQQAICIYPNGVNYTINSQSEYSASGFAEKLYYIAEGVIGNVTQHISLFLTPGTSQVTFTVTDFNDAPVENAVIKVKHYDVGTDSAYTSEILQTNTEGEAYAQIVLNDQYYQFVIELNGVVVLETLPAKITQTSKTFRITTGDDFFDTYNQVLGVSGTVVYYNETKTFSYTFTNSQGLAVEGCLEVKRNTLGSASTLYEQCETTASGTKSYTITETTDGKGYIATGYIIIGGNKYIIDVEEANFNTNSEVWGTEGLFGAFLLFITLVLIGIWSPVASLSLGLLAIIISMIAGFIYLSWGGIIALVIMTAIYLYKLKR